VIYDDTDTCLGVLLHDRQCISVHVSFLYCDQTKELRNSGDETARIIIASINEGLVPSANLRRDFEHMLSMVILYDFLHTKLMLRFSSFCTISYVLEANASVQQVFMLLLHDKVPSIILLHCKFFDIVKPYFFVKKNF